MIRRIPWLMLMDYLAMPVMLTGAVLRIAGLTTAPFWYDEAFTVYMTRLSIGEMVRAASLDFNPPMWDLVVYPFVRLFGETEAASRAPALLASLISLYLAWRLICHFIPIIGDNTSSPAAARCHHNANGDKQFTSSTMASDQIGYTGLADLAPRCNQSNQIAARFVAVVLISFLPGLIWSAQDGRVYALLSCLYLAGLWAVIKSSQVGFTACLVLILYSHNIGAIYAAVLLITAMLISPSRWKRHVISGAVAAVLFSPWLPAYWHSTGQDFWLGNFTWSSVLASAWQVMFVGALPGQFINGLAVLTIMTSVICAVIISIGPVVSAGVGTSLFRAGDIVSSFIGLQGIGRKISITEPVDRRLAILGVYAVGPLAVMVLVSPIKNLIFYRPLTPMLIPVCIWLAGVLTPKRITVTTWVLPYTWLILIITGLAGWNPLIKGGNLRDVIWLINQQYQPGDVIYHATGTSFLPFSLYLKQPAYLLDEIQPDGLLQQPLQDLFGIQRAGLEAIPHQRAWIIWARDPLDTDRANQRMAMYTSKATLVSVVRGWHFAPIEIYLTENGD